MTRINTASRLESLLNPPYGGELRELFVPPGEIAAGKRLAATLPAWDLTERQSCDLELLLEGLHELLILRGGIVRRRHLVVHVHPLRRGTQRVQADVLNLTNRLNVINFAGLFSGTAIGPPRSIAVRLSAEF